MMKEKKFDFILLYIFFLTKENYIMLNFLPSHTNSGLLFVTNIVGKEYIFVDILLSVIAGRQFYEYKVEPFLKSYGFYW